MQLTYSTPGVIYAGPVSEVTLGKNGFDEQDRTEYKKKVHTDGKRP